MRSGLKVSGGKRAPAAAYGLIFALSLTLGGCLGETFQRGYVLPEGALEQIRLGASQEQVLIVLGTPSTVATVSGEAFYYISQRAERPLSFMPTHSPTSASSPSISTAIAGFNGSPPTASRTARCSISSAAPRRPPDPTTTSFRVAPHPGKQPHRRSGLVIPATLRSEGIPARFSAVGHGQCASTASNNSATMLVILIIGLTAGPAVSL